MFKKKRKKKTKKKLKLDELQLSIKNQPSTASLKLSNRYHGLTDQSVIDNSGKPVKGKQLVGGFVPWTPRLLFFAYN